LLVTGVKDVFCCACNALQNQQGGNEETERSHGLGLVYTEGAPRQRSPARHTFKYNADEKIELLQAVLGGGQSTPDLAGRNQA
jgi:hypothetical protein